MNNQIFDWVKKYCVNNLISLENLVEGKNIMIPDPEWNEPDEDPIVFKNIGTYKIERIKKSTILESELKEKYIHYVADFSLGKNNTILQSLNYDKFNDHPLIFKDAVYWELYRLQELIKTGLNDLIMDSVNQENINVTGLISLTVENISSARDSILKNIEKSSGRFMYPIFSGQNTRDIVTQAMLLTSGMQEEFLKNLREDYNKFLGANELKIQVLQPKLLNNPYPNIFSDDFAYTLFNRLYNHFKDHKSEEANFSFVWYALEKDKLVICKQNSFINFLGDLNIFLSKINSTQKNDTNTKWSIYQSLKNSLL